MIINLTSFQRHFSCAALLAGIFSAASALATPQVTTPTFSPAGGAYTSVQSVTITSATNGASIVYTTDGSIPTESGGTITHGTVYTGAIPVASTATLSAIAFENGFVDSAVAIDGYTLQPATSPAITPFVTTQVAAPAFNPGPATFGTAAAVAMTSSTGGASIRYTTDGSTPTETNGTLYTSAVYINSTTTLNAIAYETGFTDSPVTSGTYTLNLATSLGFNIIYNFTASNNGGINPDAGLVQGTDGNFYGTTQFGGSNNRGTLFKVTSTGTLTSLVSFNNANGSYPLAALVPGTDGNFYGTTQFGGRSSDGTVFQMTPAGTLTSLVSFTGTNGNQPQSALVQGTDGNFYGTTNIGGSSNLGTVFKVTPTGTLTSLISFTGTNGANPQAALVQGTDGNFYGTTNIGGNNNLGTVFRVTSTGALTSFYSFTGTDGANPVAALVQGTDGNFYGTTSKGGDSANDGTVFKMTSTGVLTTLVTLNRTNGSQPMAALVQGSDGNFYGTTKLGGGFGNGTVFKMTSAGVLTTLVFFNWANGTNLMSGVVQGSDGNFYGTAIFGGSTNNGVIFQLIISVVAPTFSPALGTYASAQTVTITTTTSGAQIVYTTDGSTPTESGGTVTHGTLYSGPISISATTTLNAMAFKSGLDSPVTTGTYTIGPAPTPASPASGGSGGGGAPSYWFLGFLAFAGILRWRFRQTQAARAGAFFNHS